MSDRVFGGRRMVVLATIGGLAPDELPLVGGNGISIRYARGSDRLPDSGEKSERRRRLALLRSKGPAGQADRMERFERLVAEALEDIPEPFRSSMRNVAVIVEEYPDPQLLASLGLSRREDLLGFYDGIPLTARGEGYNLVPPDRIILYRKPILAICSTAGEIREQVRKTVLHEVGHHYGMTEEDLHRLGLD